MEKVTKYKAVDGKLFKDSDECRKYEENINKVNKIMVALNPIPEDSCEFMNGEGYIKQNLKAVKKAENELFKLGCEIFKLKPSQWGKYSIGRVFDDSGFTFIYSAWGRLNNIDKFGREWGQGYYAINPDKGKQEPFMIK